MEETKSILEEKEKSNPCKIKHLCLRINVSATLYRSKNHQLRLNVNKLIIWKTQRNRTSFFHRHDGRATITPFGFEVHSMNYNTKKLSLAKIGSEKLSSKILLRFVLLRKAYQLGLAQRSSAFKFNHYSDLFYSEKI